MSRKIPISVNEEDYKKVLELAELLGLDPKVYGWFPRTIRISISFALESLKTQANLIPNLKSSEIDLWLSSIKKLKTKAELEEKALKLKEMAQKV